MKFMAVVLSFIMGISAFSFNTFADTSGSSDLNFSFTSEYKDGFLQLYANKVVPKYSSEKAYGFVNKTTSMPDRYVNPDKIKITSEGFSIVENDPDKYNITYGGEPSDITKSTTYDLGGMCFRVNAPAGGYHIEVGVKGGEENSSVSISSMQPQRVNNTEFWDAAKDIPNLHMGKWEDNVYSLDYANGNDFIDIEIEPTKFATPSVLQFVKITPLQNNKADKNTIYLLGDSTLKSYLFEEAPMCGWGQVFDRLFDTDKINVKNYSMGGRSVKQMYQEGRLNDVLMTGSEGDFVFIQSGHNDEKKGSDSDPTARFGTGSTEAMYKKYLETNYIPAVRARGMIPILVTPMTRANNYDKGEFKNSFTTEDRQFVKVMKEVAEDTNTPLVDLNTLSCEYLTSLGYDGAMAVVMSLEAGETPAKTNSGSYANGHPDNKIDTTHMKEALAKQYARLVVQSVKELAAEYAELGPVVEAMTENVKNDNWRLVYPEVCNDTLNGENAYYRNQIEKMVQLGVMTKDTDGNFRPKENITAADYQRAINKLYSTSINVVADKNAVLTREEMARLNILAYKAKFGEKPAYMTDYNGTNITPDDPNYDSNLVGEEAQYYPLVGFNNITDRNEISQGYTNYVREAYELGLIRSDDCERGKMENGYTLEPLKAVTRDKAAKSLYFMYVLSSDINTVNSTVE